MAAEMIAGANRSLCRARATALCAAAVSAGATLAAILPAGAPAVSTTTHTHTTPTFPVPASARVRGNTTTPATTTRAATTPTATTPTTTAPANGGAQPGTVAPTTGTPTTAVPPTARTQTSTVPGATTSTGSPAGLPLSAAHRAGPRKKQLSTGALALAALGALLALGCAVWVVGRWLALEPRWTVSMMHSLREASHRASATWAEFADWARIGR